MKIKSIIINKNINNIILKNDENEINIDFNYDCDVEINNSKENIDERYNKINNINFFVGPNGSGKTMMMNTIYKMLQFENCEKSIDIKLIFNNWDSFGGDVMV